jgi:hypothetical protein
LVNQALTRRAAGADGTDVKTGEFSADPLIKPAEAPRQIEILTKMSRI